MLPFKRCTNSTNSSIINPLGSLFSGLSHVLFFFHPPPPPPTLLSPLSTINSSDTVREVGKSKATLVAQQTQLFTRAVLFAILNPQENGACFAGMRAELGRKDVSRYAARSCIHAFGRCILLRLFSRIRLLTAKVYRKDASQFAHRSCIRSFCRSAVN